MKHYSSYNRQFRINGVIATVIMIALIWFGQKPPFNEVTVKVFATGVVILAWWLIAFQFVRRQLASITIDESGVGIGQGYVGPLRSLSDFSVYALRLREPRPERRCGWDEIKSIRIGRWWRWWFILISPARLLWALTYLIIETTAGELFVAQVVGSPWKYPLFYKNELITGLQKAGKGHLLDPQIVKF